MDFSFFLLFSVSAFSSLSSGYEKGSKGIGRSSEKEKDYHYDETNPVEYIHPALQGDTLEGGEHCQHKVVEVGDPKIGPLCFFYQKR